MVLFLTFFYPRLSLCNRSQIEWTNSGTIFDTSEKLHMAQFVVSILVPVVCLLGIVTNSLLVHVIRHKSNQKELDKNHYKYLKLNSQINIGILAIEPLSQIVLCRGFIVDFVCSPARFLLFFQFFNMIVVEYISHTLRLLSNFVYVGFAINRLSLVGTQNGKFITSVSKLSNWQFLVRVALPSMALAVVKIFDSLPNSYEPISDYPFSSTDLYKLISDPLLYTYLTFKFLYLFINYFVFLIINLAIDILLTVRMKRTLDEKKAKKISISQATSESNK